MTRVADDFAVINRRLRELREKLDDFQAAEPPKPWPSEPLRPGELRCMFCGGSNVVFPTAARSVALCQDCKHRFVVGD